MEQLGGAATRKSFLLLNIFFSCSVLLVLEHGVDFVLLLSVASHSVSQAGCSDCSFPPACGSGWLGAAPKLPISLGAS